MDTNTLKRKRKIELDRLKDYWGDLEDDQIEHIDDEYEKVMNKFRRKYSYITDEYDDYESNYLKPYKIRQSK